MASPFINDPLAVIYNEGYWRINKVSPMHNLNYGEAKLKQYASKISHDLAGNDAACYSKFKVVVENQHSLKYSREAPNGLLIKVSSASEITVLYEAIFLTWDNYVRILNATHLKYMLERGEKKIGVSVKNSLRTLFDCHIHQFNFTQPQLMQFGLNFIQRDTSRSTDPFILHYKTPQANFKDTISLTFEIGDMWTIFQSVLNDYGDDEASYSSTYQIIQQQLYFMVKLNMYIFDLCVVTLPKAEVKSCGIAKLKTPEMIDAFFKVLNRITSQDEHRRV